MGSRFCFFLFFPFFFHYFFSDPRLCFRSEACSVLMCTISGRIEWKSLLHLVQVVGTKHHRRHKLLLAKDFNYEWKYAMRSTNPDSLTSFRTNKSLIDTIGLGDAEICWKMYISSCIWKEKKRAILQHARTTNARIHSNFKTTQWKISHDRLQAPVPKNYVASLSLTRSFKHLLMHLFTLTLTH